MNLNNKERKTDRVLVLKPMEGQNTLSSIGLVDNRLFKGGNQLHAIQDSRNKNWFLKYEVGGLPPKLKQRFTNFDILYKFANQYFEQRGLKIDEVLD